MRPQAVAGEGGVVESRKVEQTLVVAQVAAGVVAAVVGWAAAAQRILQRCSRQMEWMARMAQALAAEVRAAQQALMATQVAETAAGAVEVELAGTVEEACKGITVPSMGMQALWLQELTTRLLLDQISLMGVPALGL
jgi:hypothetical protein